MFLSSLRRTAGAAAVTTLGFALAASLPAVAEATVYAYGGSAYGSLAKVGTTVRSDKTSYIPMCTTSSTYKKSSNTAALDLDELGNVGAVVTKLTSKKSGSTRTATATTDTAATSLLGGLITADAITTEAKAVRSSKGYSTSGGTKLVNLHIAGLPVDATPAKNTTVSIPGIATVKLNAQSTSDSYGSEAINVTALKVTVLDANPLGLPKATVVVGAANASIHKPVHNRPYGSAYGTQVDLGGVVKSGPTAYVVLPCGGSSSKTLTNSVADASLPGAAEIGAVSSSGKSTDGSKTSTATTSAKVADIDVLDGTVTADAVTAKATVTRKGKKLDTSSDGTKIVGLKVLGESVEVPTKANSTIAIADVGTLTLRKSTKSSTGLTVAALQLKLSTDVGDLTKGTVITIGAAKAGVTYH